MVGGYYCFRLHFIINNQSGIILIKITTPNVDDLLG
ncbi:transposase [Candidatus Enterovibrio escicola]